MDILDMLADRRIEEAIAEGKLDNLPGKGKPLKLEDDPFTPAEMRPVYRMLKQAGIVPGWVQLGRDTASLDAEIATEEERLVRERNAWAQELAFGTSPERTRRALAWHAASRLKFIELVRRRAGLVRHHDMAAPRAAARPAPESVEERIRRFDQRFRPLQ